MNEPSTLNQTTDLMLPICSGANPDKDMEKCPRCGVGKNELCLDEMAHDAQSAARRERGGITAEDVLERLTPAALARLEALAKEATRGPWSVSDDCYKKPHYPDNGAIWVFSDMDCDSHPIADCSCNHTCRMEWDQQANASFIAAADPPTILAIIKRIRDLEAANDK